MKSEVTNFLYTRLPKVFIIMGKREHTNHEIQTHLDSLFSKIKKIENKIEFKQDVDLKTEIKVINMIAFSIQKTISSHYKRSQDE